MLGISISTFAQETKIPVVLKEFFPHTSEQKISKDSIQKILALKPELKNLFLTAKDQVKDYVAKHQQDFTWMPSRLQMYWKTKASKVYIKGGVYAHSEGSAPVPTVRYPGARDHVTIYAAPKIEDLIPYADDVRGVWMINKNKPGQPLEWADPSKTGRIIESINNNIIGLAYKASVVYWITGDENHARFALDVFDTYMTGMDYRNAPEDISHGHHSTIAGLSTFEVIQEVAILKSLTGAFKNLYPFIEKSKKDKIETYVRVFKKWADVQITNGVAFNNWNLMEAMNIVNIASLLGPDDQYTDKKGAQFYLDQVLNTSTERQWSLQKSVNYGFDTTTGLWNESPGYALMVVSDFTGFVQTFDEVFGMDILDHFPILEKGAIATAQYLFPNGYISAFGDSYYRRLHVNAALQLISHAQKYGKRELEEKLTRYVKTLDLENQIWGGESLLKWSNGQANNLKINLPFSLDESIPPGKIQEYVTPVIYSPKVSYFAQRNGYDPKNGLMVAMIGSKGNHMHANGISMEIFGKGYVLGPDAGIGGSYFSSDYLEYYSRFPAHNTVAVDGISNYPEMKSNHGFSLVSSYPRSGQTSGYYPGITFGDLHFLEPETQSDQRRFTTTVRINEQAGYYLDIFRSARKDQDDKFHDYFYHNLGQELKISDKNQKEVTLKETSALSFSGGHLFAYDYLYDKKSVVSSEDMNARFTLSIPEKENVYMNLWIKGFSDREIFSVKSPQTKSFRGNVMLPDSVVGNSTPTLVIRQNGEARTKPFVVIYEPTTDSEPSAIASINSFQVNSAPETLVSLEVLHKNGSADRIYNLDKEARIEHENQTFEGTYGLIRTENQRLKTLFLGNGKLISSGDYNISLKESGAATLYTENGSWYLNATKSGVLSLPSELNIQEIRINGKVLKNTSKKKSKIVTFDFPVCEYQQIMK